MAGQRRLQILLAAAVLLLALGLRVYGLDAQSLWNDEGTSVAVAQRDPATIARDAAHDIHPPLYYWVLSGWVQLLGTSEAAVRSLSALLGVALVALTYALGRLLGGRWVALAAALLAAINPFQVVYSQEARMYMLLAVLGALAFYAALRWAAAPAGRRRGWAGLYVLAAAAGLYTHYAFPMVLLAANLVIGIDAVRRSEGGPGKMGRWLALQLAVVALFAPWLPAAIRQLAAWPEVAEPFGAGAAARGTWQWLMAGPAVARPTVEPWWAPILLLAVLMVPLPRRREPGAAAALPDLTAAAAPALWLAVPVALMLALGLFQEAYFKFLLVASPAFCLLLARLLSTPPAGRRLTRPGRAALVFGRACLWVIFAGIMAWTTASYLAQRGYVRDDYRGIAAYIEAVGRPGDSVVLNAPGQQEVFGYYYRGGLPVAPLPADRPPDAARTEAALAGLAARGGRIWAVLWATAESDPQRLVEGWLDRHTFKALDAWYGNVRLAAYAAAGAAPQAPARRVDVPLRGSADDEIVLEGYHVAPAALAAGDIVQVTLFWRAAQTPARRYKVFVHVLDAAGHIAGQMDSEPGGGARLTTLWAPGETVVDRYGVAVHPATPPGEYRIEVGLYDLETGERPAAPDGANQVWLEPVVVGRPAAPPPLLALGMAREAHSAFGAVALVGYDAHRLGFGHQPDAPLHPGDVLHVNLYWRATGAPGADWLLALGMIDEDGVERARLDSEPVPGYGTAGWQAGDVWRGQFDVPLPGEMPPGSYRLRVQPLPPGEPPPEPFVSDRLYVEP